MLLSLYHFCHIVQQRVGGPHSRHSAHFQARGFLADLPPWRLSP